MFKRCDADFGDFDDSYLHDDSPGKVRDGEHRMPDLPVRRLPERTRRHTDRSLERPAKCLGTVETGTECRLQYRMIRSGSQAVGRAS